MTKTGRAFRRSVEGLGEIVVVLDRADLAINTNIPYDEGRRIVDLLGRCAEATAIATAGIVMADARYRQKAARAIKAATGTDAVRKADVEGSDWFLDMKMDIAQAQADLEYAKGFMVACKEARAICEGLTRADNRGSERMMVGRIDVGGGEEPRWNAHRADRQEVARMARERKGG